MIVLHSVLGKLREGSVVGGAEHGVDPMRSRLVGVAAWMMDIGVSVGSPGQKNLLPEHDLELVDRLEC